MKIIISTKFACLLALIAGLACPINTLAFSFSSNPRDKESEFFEQQRTTRKPKPEERNEEEVKPDEKKSEQGRQAATQNLPANAPQDEQAVKNFFKDATYNNFAPQEDAEKTTENYLGPES